MLRTGKFSWMYWICWCPDDWCACLAQWLQVWEGLEYGEASRRRGCLFPTHRSCNIHSAGLVRSIVRWHVGWWLDAVKLGEDDGNCWLWRASGSQGSSKVWPPVSTTARRDEDSQCLEYRALSIPFLQAQVAVDSKSQNLMSCQAWRQRMGWSWHRKQRPRCS